MFETLYDMCCLLTLKVLWIQTSYFSWEFLVHYFYSSLNDVLRPPGKVYSYSKLHSFLHICSICNSSPVYPPQCWRLKSFQYQRHSQLGCTFCLFSQRNPNQPSGTCIQSRTHELWKQLKLLSIQWFGFL